jgi:hypothetical protein
MVRVDGGTEALNLRFRQHDRRLRARIAPGTRNRALHYLANEPKLSDELREHLAQVVHGYVGPCAPVAARKGIEWMRR